MNCDSCWYCQNFVIMGIHGFVCELLVQEITDPEIETCESHLECEEME